MEIYTDAGVSGFSASGFTNVDCILSLCFEKPDYFRQYILLINLREVAVHFTM